MPRHSYGARSLSPELQHHEHRLGIRLTSSKLTRIKRDLARADPAVAAHFKRRIREPARFNAFMAGQSGYTSDTPCSRCGSHKRTTYTASCWDCQLQRRPLQLDDRNEVTGWPIPQRTRDSFLDLHDRRRRARAGEFEELTVGDVLARKYPDGRLFLQRRECYPRFRIDDANRLPPQGAAWLLDQMAHDPNLRAVADWDNW